MLIFSWVFYRAKDERHLKRPRRIDLDNLDSDSVSFINSIRGFLPSSVQELVNVVVSDTKYRIPIGTGNLFTQEFSSFVEKCCRHDAGCCSDFFDAFLRFDTLPSHACEFGSEMEVVPYVNAALFPLQLLLQAKIGRNTKASTTGSKLPDFKLSVGPMSIPIMLGEDKAISNYQRGVPKKDPVLDLVSKAPWDTWEQFYGSLPFYFGYTSIGGPNEIVLSIGVLVKATRSFESLLTKRIDRALERAEFAIGLVKLFPVVAEVARLAQLISGPHWVIEKFDYTLIVRKKMTIAFENNIALFRKEWIFASREIAHAFYTKLTEVFAKIKTFEPSLPVIRLHSNLHWDETLVRGYFTPYGKQLSIEDESELLRIMVRVAEVVLALHNLGVIHNDIRWDNIVKTDDDICIVDFDDAFCFSESQPKCPALNHVGADNHSVLSFQPHGSEVDRWSLANLLSTCTLAKGRVSLETLQLAQAIRDHCDSMETIHVVSMLEQRKMVYDEIVLNSSN